MRRSAIHEQRSIHDYEVIKSCPSGQFIVIRFANYLLARAFLRRAPMPQAHDRAHRAIAPRLAPARRSAAIISRFDVSVNDVAKEFAKKLQI